MNSGTNRSLMDIGRQVAYSLRVSKAPIAPISNDKKEEKRSVLSRHFLSCSASHRQRKLSTSSLGQEKVLEPELESILTEPKDPEMVPPPLRRNHTVSGDFCLIQEGPLWILRVDYKSLLK